MEPKSLFPKNECQIFFWGDLYLLPDVQKCSRSWKMGKPLFHSLDLFQVVLHFCTAVPLEQALATGVVVLEMGDFFLILGILRFSLGKIFLRSPHQNAARFAEVRYHNIISKDIFLIYLKIHNNIFRFWRSIKVQ